MFLGGDYASLESETAIGIMIWDRGVGELVEGGYADCQGREVDKVGKSLVRYDWSKKVLLQSATLEVRYPFRKLSLYYSGLGRTAGTASFLLPFLDSAYTRIQSFPLPFSPELTRPEISCALISWSYSMSKLPTFFEHDASKREHRKHDEPSPLLTS